MFMIMNGRAIVAVVSQDDSLLQGTLAENITGFDEGIDMTRVRLCAQLAQIHADIERMPWATRAWSGTWAQHYPGARSSAC
jgi:ABC-type bacteriocin/lantibiotic exporter with double-glycine peptidase domain